MASSKAMAVGEMASLFPDPITLVRTDVFDSSYFGPADTDLGVKIAIPSCMYQPLACPNEIDVMRSYIPGDFDVDGIGYTDPYPATRKLVPLSKHVCPLIPTLIARISTGILSRGFKKPPVSATEGLSKFAHTKHGLMSCIEKADSETASFRCDMSNKFYVDFLGPSMTYTCAIFDNEYMSLGDAQANKLRLILDRPDLQPGQHLLDIGCGWSSMAITTARRGIKALGVILFKGQAVYANE